MDTLLGYSHTDLDASFPGMVSKDVAAVRLQAGFVLEFELSTTHTTSLLRSSNITNNNVVFVSRLWHCIRYNVMTMYRTA